jgi:hypothetical protein
MICRPWDLPPSKADAVDSTISYTAKDINN